ncbi:MAG: PLP-dependent aminotransferase family protein [Pseudomonadota bacterium]
MTNSSEPIYQLYMTQIADFHVREGFDPTKGSLSRQLADEIRRRIEAGTLIAGDRIPPTRQLAKDLGIARGTVTTAVEMLLAEGILEARVGSGTFVAKDANQASVRPRREGLPNVEFVTKPIELDVDKKAPSKVDLRPCRPSLETFPLNVWRRCISQAASAVPDSDYGDPLGNARLREEIAAYLRRARGMQVDTGQIIVTNGAVHAMYLIASLLLNPKRSVVFEDPGYPLARQVFSRTGAEMVFAPIDRHGMQLDRLDTATRPTRLVYVTPSHQFPVGSRLSLGRRAELLSWAEANGALIVEDDYDGEFRYDVPPLTPMAAMAPHLVVYCGTFSKTMFPGLRIGFAVADKSIIEAMACLRGVSEYSPNEPLQLALSKFIREGEYERHVLRTRRHYAAKRKSVAERLAPQAKLTGLDSGLSGLIELPSSIPANEVSMRLRDKGVLIPEVGRYVAGQMNARNALVCGYAEPSLKRLEMGLQTINAEIARY